MYLAKNLKYLRLKSGFSQEYLADKFGYKSYTTIQKWEMGTSEPSLAVLSKLSSMYNVKMDTMYAVDLEVGAKNNNNVKSIPLIGTIAAGLPILAEENIEDYFAIDSRIKADFALKVKGDSMINAGINQDDIVFIRKQETLENGEIGAILLDDEATLKRFYKENGSVILQAENEKYKPRIFVDGNMKVLGKLIAVLNVRE